MTNIAKGRMSPFVLAVSRAALTMGQGENPVFRITKKPPSETGVKKPRYLSPFFYGFEFS